MKYLLATSCALSFLLLATLSAVPADDGQTNRVRWSSLQSPPDPYADAEDLNDALEILREKLRSDGKADFAALLSANRVKQAIRTAVESYESLRKDRERRREKGVITGEFGPKRDYIRIANQGFWWKGCTFSTIYSLTDKRGITYEAFLLRLTIGRPEHPEFGFALPIIDLTFGQFDE